MSLSPKINIRPGTERQQNVGIMGRAVVELQVSGSTIVKLSNIQVRKTKAGKWWVQYPAEEDRTGKQDDNGYPVRYPHYVLFPGETGKANRDQLHQKIINECQNAVGASGVSSAPAPKVDTQPVLSSAPPVTNTQPADAGDELQWDLDG